MVAIPNVALEFIKQAVLDIEDLHNEYADPEGDIPEVNLRDYDEEKTTIAWDLLENMQYFFPV